MVTGIVICFVGDSFADDGDDESIGWESIGWESIGWESIGWESLGWESLGWPGRLCADARRLGHCVTPYNPGVCRDTSACIAARWEREA